MPTLKLQAEAALAVTPSDTQNIVPPFGDGAINRGCVLYIGSGGDLTVVTPNGDEVTFTNIPNAYMLPVNVLRVKASGTTASDIIALW